MRPVILLLAKAAIAAQPNKDMQALCEAVAAQNPDHDVTYALQELGSPSLRDRINQLTDDGVEEIIILSLLIPMEPAFPTWLKRSVHRWKKKRVNGPWPRIRLAQPPMEHTEELIGLLTNMADAANEQDVVSEAFKMPSGSVVGAQKYRFLLCAGGACNDAGAISLYNHLRNEQDRLKLKEHGLGMAICKTSCLGPCSLAPVAQVWPEGTIYAGLDEEAIEHILDQHIQMGRVVEGLSFERNGRKQRLS